jgi:hypothetical protein
MTAENDDFERLIYDVARDIARVAVALEAAAKSFETIASTQQKIANPVLDVRVDGPVQFRSL